VDAGAPPSPQRFYRVVATALPKGMALIPAGVFQMGDSLDHDAVALPVHSVTLSAFFVDNTPVTYSHWQQVYLWATNHGYAFDNPGLGKAASHPAQTMNWYDAVKWCNARSEMEGLTPCYYTSAAQTNFYRVGDIDLANAFVNWNAAGYRLPTEAEWEKAARGGAGGHRFPWSDVDTIDTSRANYTADPTVDSYDISVYAGTDPVFKGGGEPYTNPVQYFLPNGYGVYDAIGNVVQWCWDSYASYSAAAQTDPRSPSVGRDRVGRGGNWGNPGSGCRVALRSHGPAGDEGYQLGFRCVRTTEQ
jgi:formylglycine-generating enzyme required for sulfatase activity